jgi:hypothetical protein
MIKLKPRTVFIHFNTLFKNRFSTKKPVLLIAFILFIVMAAFGSMFWITPHGSGVSPDSTIYIGGAKSILTGKGFTINGSPIIHFPPLYSLFLTAINLFENNLVQTARFLNACLFGINAGLIALSVYLTTDRKYLTSVLAALFFASSADFVNLHAWAWSEPLFISLSLACLIFLWLYFNRPTPTFLIASSLSLGCALVTRYIGAAFVPAALVIVYWGGKGRPFIQRLFTTLIWLMITCLPTILFLLRNMIVAQSATDRSLAIHPLPVLRYLSQLMTIGFTFIVPVSFPAGLMAGVTSLIAIFLIVVGIIFFMRRRKDNTLLPIDIAMPAACLLLSVSYILFLYLSISFMDASTPVDTRLLSPILVLLIVGGFSAIWAISKSFKSPIVRTGLILIAAVLIAFRTLGSFQTAQAIQKNGLGYNTLHWINSESIAFVNELPGNVVIYSNGADVLGFLTEKESLSVPRKADPGTMKPNPLYEEELNAMCKNIVDGKALMLFFNQITWRWYLPNQEEVASGCKLSILQSFGDGIIFGDTPR